MAYFRIFVLLRGECGCLPIQMELCGKIILSVLELCGVGYVFLSQVAVLGVLVKMGRYEECENVRVQIIKKNSLR